MSSSGRTGPTSSTLSTPSPRSWRLWPRGTRRSPVRSPPSLASGTSSPRGRRGSERSLPLSRRRPGVAGTERPAAVRAPAATGVTIFQNPDDRAYFRRHRLVRPGRDALVLGSGIDFTPLQVDGAAVGRLRREVSVEGRVVGAVISRPAAQKGGRGFIHA